MLVATHPMEAAPQASKRTRRGATMMEYLFVLSFIGVACMVGIGYFGSETDNLTKGASSAINRSLTAPPGSNALPPTGVLPSGSVDDGENTDQKGKKDKGKGKKNN